MKNFYFAVDLGATSGRTILGSLEDGSIKMDVINRFPNHLIQVGKHFYWDLFELYRNIVEGLKIVAKQGITPASIGIDTWGVDFVCIGKDGEILRQPFAYRDPHTERAPERMFARFSRKKIYEKTGIQVMNFNSIFQLDTMRNNNDSALEAADKVLFIPDALSYLLTGKAVTEYTIASTGQIINAASRQFDEEILAAVGLGKEKFGRLVYPGEIIGTLTDEIQKKTGLGAVPVIAVAGHDTASAVAAVPASTPNFAYLSSGTWSLMGIETKEPVINAKTEELNYTNEGGVDHTIRVLKNICGMWLLERCRLEWGAVEYDTLISEAKDAVSFRSLINPNDPCFANPANMPEAINAYCKNTNQPIPETRGQIVRCIFESLALCYRNTMDNLLQLSDHPIEALHIIGGGSRNNWLNELTSNATGLKVVAGPAEATALGNIMIQCIAAGEGTDIKTLRNTLSSSSELKHYEPADKKVWEEAYNKYLSIIK